MTRDEQRAKCIEAMLDGYEAALFKVIAGKWTNLAKRMAMTAAFDSLHGIAVVRRRHGLESFHDELTNAPEKP